MTATGITQDETPSAEAAPAIQTPHDAIAEVLGPDVARMALDALELHLRRHVLAPGIAGVVAFTGAGFMFAGLPLGDGEDDVEPEQARAAA